MMKGNGLLAEPGESSDTRGRSPGEVVGDQVKLSIVQLAAVSSVALLIVATSVTV
jgi:hypothetical protein